jgi:hypothetical protein
MEGVMRYLERIIIFLLGSFFCIAMFWSCDNDKGDENKPFTPLEHGIVIFPVEDTEWYTGYYYVYQYDCYGSYGEHYSDYEASSHDGDVRVYSHYYWNEWMWGGESWWSYLTEICYGITYFDLKNIELVQNIADVKRVEVTFTPKQHVAYHCHLDAYICATPISSNYGGIVDGPKTLIYSTDSFGPKELSFEIDKDQFIGAYKRGWLTLMLEGCDETDVYFYGHTRSEELRPTLTLYF